MHVINHPFLRVMRKPGTISRTHLINRTLIILKIQELAGLRPVHPIALAILTEILTLKGINRHSDVRCYPHHVATRVGW